MQDKKTDKQKYIVGYEFGYKTSQISYLKEGMTIPESISLQESARLYNFPNVLAKRKEVNQWMFGHEAEECVERGEAVLVDNLLENACQGTMVDVAGNEFEAVALLALFFKKSLSLLNLLVDSESEIYVMFTIPNLDVTIIKTIQKAMERMEGSWYRLFFQGYEESFANYVLHEAPAAWSHRVMLCDYNHQGDDLNIYTMSINDKTRPRVISIDKDNTKAFNSDDEQFREITSNIMSGNKYSGVYLVGKGFEDDWYKGSLKTICMGRKVFRGSNLYSIGAVYSLKEIILPSDISKNYIYLGSTKLKANVGIEVMKCGKDTYVPLLDGGKNWYDEKGECEIILGEAASVRLTVTPLNGKESKQVEILLDDLPDRPKKTIRLHISLRCEGPEEISATIEEVGFGKLFPATHKIWNERFTL